MGVRVDIPSREYERACLEAVRATLSKIEPERDRTSVESIELIVGKDDDRRIVATIVRHGRRRTVEWQLYEDVFTGEMPPGEAEYPKEVALQMMIWATGG